MTNLIHPAIFAEQWRAEYADLCSEQELEDFADEINEGSRHVVSPLDPIIDVMRVVRRLEKDMLNSTDSDFYRNGSEQIKRWKIQASCQLLSVIEMEQRKRFPKPWAVNPDLRVLIGEETAWAEKTWQELAETNHADCDDVLNEVIKYATDQEIMFHLNTGMHLADATEIAEILRVRLYKALRKAVQNWKDALA